MSKGIFFPKRDGSGLRVGLVVARWNAEYTSLLRDDAVRALRDCGVTQQNIFIQEVPGSFELIFGTKAMLAQSVDVVICVGVLIKGETMHFEFLADAVINGIMQLNKEQAVPVIFGVLTCLTEEQAQIRSSGEKAHGYGWGMSAVEMALLK